MLTNDMIIKAARMFAVLTTREIFAAEWSNSTEFAAPDRQAAFAHAFNNSIGFDYMSGKNDHFDNVRQHVNYLRRNADWLHNSVAALMYLRFGDRTIRKFAKELDQ